MFEYREEADCDFFVGLRDLRDFDMQNKEDKVVVHMTRTRKEERRKARQEGELGWGEGIQRNQFVTCWMESLLGSKG